MSAPIVASINTFDEPAKDASYKITGLVAVNLNGTMPIPVKDKLYKTGTQVIKLTGTFPNESAWTDIQTGFTLVSSVGGVVKELDDFIFSITTKEIIVTPTEDIGPDGFSGFIGIQREASGAPITSYEFKLESLPAPAP